MAAPPVGTANAVVTPTSSAYLDVWVQSASGVDQALLANVAGVASTMTQFATSPATKSVAVPSGGACMSFMAYRNTGASVLTPSGVTANGTPPGSSYAHTAFGVSQSISSYGWSWTNGSAGGDIISMHALPINASSSLASFAGSVTLDDVSPTGTFSTVPNGSFSGSVTLDDAGVSGSFSPAPGTLTSDPLTTNNGTVLASVSLDFVCFYNDTTGALILRKTGLSTNGSGIFSVTDALLVPGTTYRIDWQASTGQRRMPRRAAT